MRRVRERALVVALVCATLPGLQSQANANPVAGLGYSSSYSGESKFTNAGPGEAGQFSAVFFNDGTQAWVPGIVGLLVCTADKITCNVPWNATFNRGWYSPTVYATVTATVQPGQNGFFVYNFAVPVGTPGGTATTFYGDVGLIPTGALLRPEGYFQVNTAPVSNPVVSPASASVAVGAFQQFAVTGGPPGASVAWSVTGGCGAITGVGLFVATVMNSVTQPCQAVAVIAGRTLAAPITVFGGVAQMACSVSPRSIRADGGVTTAGTAVATITLKDANGNVAANATSPLISVVNVTPTLASMSPIGSVTPSAGTVSVAITSTNLAGDIQLSASAPGLTGCNAITTSTGPGAASQTVATFLSGPLAADGVSTATLQIDVTDAQGIRIINDNITLIAFSQAGGPGACVVTAVIQGSNGSVSSGSGTAIVQQGRVAFVVRSTTTASVCQYNVATNNSSIAGSTARLTTLTVGAPAKLALLSNNSPHPAANAGVCDLSGNATDPSCTTVVVGVQDANGVLLTGDNNRIITIALDPATCSGAGGDVLQRGSIVTSAGRARFALSSSGAYNACAFTFSSGNLFSVSTTAVWTPGNADHLACSFAPSTLTPGMTNSVGTVTVRDVLGNVVPSGSYSVTFTRTSGSTMTLSTASPQYTAGGAASFSVVKFAQLGGADTYAPALALGLLPTVLPNTSCTIVAQ